MTAFSRWVFLLAFFIGGGSLMAQDDDCDRFGRLPDNPIGQQAAALLEVICQTDEEARRVFIETRLAPSMQEMASPEDFLNALEELHDDLKGLEIVGVDMESPYVGLFELAGPGGGPWFLSLTVERIAPHRLLELGVDDTRPGPEVSFADLEDMKRYLADQAEAETFSGVVLMADQGDVIFQEAYGWANKNKGTANTTDTRFNLGSINKLFTTVAVLQLVEQGRIDLDAPLGTYLDGFPPEVADRVTIRHLLQHRSGWSAYWENPDFLARKDELNTVDDYLDFIRKIPLEFEPGTQERYSNTGFEVLGGVIERVSGQSYYDYIQQQVYEPAGMANAASIPHDSPDVATGYTQERSDGYTQTNAVWLAARGTPAGGGYATAEDLWRFEQALLGDELLSPRFTNLMLSRLESEDQEARTGGFGFAGGGPGINAVWLASLDQDHSVIVLSNMGSHTAEQVGRAALDMLDAR